MEAIITSVRGKSVRVVSALISLAFVFGGSAARADGVSQFTLAADGTAHLLGVFSAADLEQLEFANAAEATHARLAAMAEAEPVVDQPLRKVVPSRGESSRAIDPFPHLSRVVPLVVASPNSALQASQGSTLVRPGLMSQPVGVPWTRLR